MSFDFKRGDSVKIILRKDGVFTEEPGLVLKVAGEEVEVQRDSDKSLWTTDLNGKRFNVNGDQFIQLQKLFQPENNYKGQRITSGIVQLTTEQDSDGAELSVLKVDLYSDGTREPIFTDWTPIDPDFRQSMYLDLNKKFSL